MRTVHFRGIKFLLRDANSKLFSADRAAFMQVCIADEYGNLLNLIKEGDVVLDLGANIGCFTLLASRKVGTRGSVLAIEPDPGNFAQLQLNLSVNIVGNSETVNRAIYNEENVVIGWKSDGVGSMIENGAATTVLTCDISTLIDFIARNGSKHILIKSDIEGAEKYLFRDPRIQQVLENVDALAMEVHEQHVYLSIREKLMENGFSVSGIHYENDYMRNIAKNFVKSRFLPLRLYGKEIFKIGSRVLTGTLRRRTLTKGDTLTTFEPGVVFANK